MKLKHTAIAAALLAVAPFAMAEQGKASGMSTDTRASSMHSDATISDSATVRHVQEQLSQRGFDPGPIDGRMGPQTRAALRNFQQSQGMADSRGLDEKTMSALGVEKSASMTPHSSKTAGEGTMGTAPEQQTSGNRGAAPDRPGMTTTTPQGGTSRADTSTAGEGTMGTAPAQQPNASRSGTTVERPDRSSTTTTTPGGTTRSESTTAGEGTMGTAPSQQNDSTRGTTDRGTTTKRY